ERIIQTGAMPNAEIAVLGQQLYDGGTNLHRRAARWLAQCVEAESAYLDMIAAEATPQEARSVLPNSLKTEVVMTANLREWRHVLDLRCSKAAHPQMRNLMMPLFDDFRSMMPEVFETTKKQEK
ncbi:MAG: FAD-dependent thymidylate synthase, partial [Porticoccaceae bacterium]